MKYIAIAILFLLGLIFCMSYSSKDFREGFDNDNCPNLLIQKGSEIHLVNTNKAEVPGVNPITFKNLEEYVEYMDWAKANNINCPVLYLQQTYNTQGERGYRILPDPLDRQPGLPSNVEGGVSIEPVTKLLNADRDEPPYNKNNYPGFDPQNQYTGLFTPIDQIECTKQQGMDNAMCANWNPKQALKSIEQGKYLERSRPDADEHPNLALDIHSQNLGINAKTSNSIMGDRMIMDKKTYGGYSRTNPVVARDSIQTRNENQHRSQDREIKRPQERLLNAD